jgi:hypothetical protein
LHSALGLPAATRTRKPAVAELNHTLQGMFAFTTKQCPSSYALREVKAFVTGGSGSVSI